MLKCHCTAYIVFEREYCNVLSDHLKFFSLSPQKREEVDFGVTKVILGMNILVYL